MMGRTINSIPKMFWRMNDGLSGRTKWMKIMISSQTTPVKEAVLNATERKKNKSNSVNLP